MMGDWVGRRQGHGMENFVPLQPFLQLLSELRTNLFLQRAELI